MNNNTVPKSKNKMSIFRIGVIYKTGKLSGKTECMFVQAYSKEDAAQYADGLVKDLIKKEGGKDETYKVEAFPASKDEMEFYKQSFKTNYNYNGLIN